MREVYFIIALDCDEFEEDLQFDDIDGDYIVHMLFDVESDRIIFHNDNTHDDPYRFLDGFKAGIKVMGDEVCLTKIVLGMNENESAYCASDVRRALERYIQQH